MDRSLFEGKTIGDIIDDDTKILTLFVDDYDVRAQEVKQVLIRKDGPYTAVANLLGGHVICFENGKPKALFWVYDLAGISVNAKRGMVSAHGHDSINEYWFDDGEYNEKYTR